MSIRSSKVIFLSMAAVLFLAAFASAQQSQNYLILSKSQGKGSVAFADRVAAAGGSVTGTLENVGVVLATSSNPNFANNLAADSHVQAIAVDAETQFVNNEQAKLADASTVPPGADGLNAEPYTAYQWNMRYIGADKTATAGYLGQGALVAVLDAGMIYNHPDIADNVRTDLMKSFVDGEGVMPPPNAFNHGTHVAGIIAAEINGKGTQGVAPLAKIVPIKVLRASGSGTFGWLIEGLAYAESIHADIANMSLGAAFLRNPNAGCPAGVSTKDCNNGTLMAALNRAINHATQAGVFCVSAAGNDGYDLNSQYVSIPAQSGNGIAVSATGPVAGANFDRLASYSNYGQSVVNVAAPGGDFTLYPNPSYVFDMVISPGGYTVDGTGKLVGYNYYFAAGTSMAAPHVSGLAALLVGKYGHVGPTKLKQMIENSTTDILKPGADAETGKGVINAARALGVQ